MKRDVYVYPAVFEKDASGHYGVFFPDLPGCVAVGHNLQEAHKLAKEALGSHLFSMSEDNDEIPEASAVDAIQQKHPGEIIGLVEISLLAVQAKLDTRSVKKTLTVPYYLNKLAEKKKINFSRVLQEALKQRLGLL